MPAQPLTLRMYKVEINTFEAIFKRGLKAVPRLLVNTDNKPLITKLCGYYLSDNVKDYLALGIPENRGC